MFQTIFVLIFTCIFWRQYMCIKLTRRVLRKIETMILYIYLNFYKRTQGIWRWHLETKPSISLNVTCVSNLFRFSADDAGSISVTRVFQFIYAWDLSIIMTLQFSPSRTMTKHVFVTLISLTIVLHTVKHAKSPYAVFVYQPNTNHTRYTNCPIKLKNF